MSVRERVHALIEEHPDLLSEVPWASERERWHELLFAVLVQSAPNPDAASTALAILAALHVTEPSVLAALDTGPDRSLAEQILLRLGFSEETSGGTIAQLSAVGRVVQSELGGKLQRFLRTHGERMKQELVGHCVKEGLDPEVASGAVIQWLQYVLTMPVSHRHDSLLEFSIDAGGSLDEAIGAADELDLSVAALDHLVASTRSLRRMT